MAARLLRLFAIDRYLLAIVSMSTTPFAGLSAKVKAQFKAARASKTVICTDSEVVEADDELTGIPVRFAAQCERSDLCSRCALFSVRDSVRSGTRKEAQGRLGQACRGEVNQGSLRGALRA